MQQQQTITRRNQAAYALISAAFLLCLAPARSYAAQSNTVDAMCLLEEHNALRASVGVPELRWSDALARQATGWANELKKAGCGMKHSHAASLGENLYWASAQKTGARGKGKNTWRWNLTPQPIKEKTVVAGWATEEPWYSRADNTCNAPPGKTCGHYTQMVWAGTREIGCAKTVCNDSSQIWVCNYAPAGNVIGQRPY
ncbi:MAG: CAP domain-containing protein [Desulfurivibrionaceae bacterium]|jgi:pathogenesis-related protein 1